MKKFKKFIDEKLSGLQGLGINNYNFSFKKATKQNPLISGLIDDYPEHANNNFEFAKWLVQTKMDREARGIETDITQDLALLGYTEYEIINPTSGKKKKKKKERKEWAHSPCSIRALAGVFGVSDEYVYYNMNFRKYFRRTNNGRTDDVVNFLIDQGMAVWGIAWKKGKAQEPFRLSSAEDEPAFGSFNIGIDGSKAISYYGNKQGIYMFIVGIGTNPQGGHIFTLNNGRRFDTAVGYSETSIVNIIYMITNAESSHAIRD